MCRATCIGKFGIIHLHPGSGSIFRISADVGLLSALEREPFLLLRRGDDAVLLQDGPVCGLLELLAQEERVQGHLTGGDADDPERTVRENALAKGAVPRPSVPRCVLARGVSKFPARTTVATSLREARLRLGGYPSRGAVTAYRRAACGVREISTRSVVPPKRSASSPRKTRKPAQAGRCSAVFMRNAKEACSMSCAFTAKWVRQIPPIIPSRKMSLPPPVWTTRLSAISTRQAD